MKRKELNSLSRSIVEMLSSRNNDINGYWGIGMLCLVAKSKKLYKFSFKIIPGKQIKIYGCELSNSSEITSKLIKYNINSIEGRMSFFLDGRYDNGNDKYTCAIAIASTQNNRTGLFMSNIECWPHDPSIEIRREKTYCNEIKIDNGVVTSVIKWISARLH